MKVTLDGTVQPNVNLYAATTVYQQKVFTKTGLANTSHTLTLAWTGTSNGVNTATTIDLDALDVAGTLTQAPAGTSLTQESDVRLAYSTPWTPVGPSASYSGSYLRTLSAAGSVTATFTGSGISVLATKGASYGVMKVTLDGTVQPNVNLYAATAAYQQKVFTKAGLANTSHTLTLAWTGLANGANTATTIDLDALSITGSLL